MKVFTSAASAMIMIIGLVTVGHGATGMSGADMYAARCESCHGKIGQTSIIRGANSTMMEFAIKSNFGGMRKFSGISSNDLQSIAAAITSSEMAESSVGDSSTSYIPSSRVYTSSEAAQAAEVQAVTERSFSAAEVVPSVMPSAPMAPPASTGGGAALYGSSCAGCHGPMASSSKRGASASRIQAAIKGNAGGMGSLSSMSAADLQAIAEALSGGAAVASAASGGVASANTSALDTSTPAASAPVASAAATFSVPPDGSSLYASNCAFCHGPITGSAKRGATFARIQTAIGLNSGGMGSLATMQASDMMAIASALSSSGTITRSPAMASATAPAAGSAGGSSLYDTNCASCHGPLASSSKKGSSASMIQGAIGANTGGMGSLSSLSATDIQTIASELGGSSAPASAPKTASKNKAASKSTAAASTPAAAGGAGSSLYDSNCASCHGPLASSTKKGSAAASIQSAISSNTGGMGRLSSLSAADIQSIADALAGGGAAGGGGGGGGMTGVCTTCHPGGAPSGTMGGERGGGKGGGKAKGEGNAKGGKSKGGESHGGGEHKGGGGD